MADYPGILVNCEASLALIKTVTFSGTVVDGSANPLQRTIVGYCQPDRDISFTTESDPSDGSWELDIKATPSGRFTIYALGGAGENADIFDWLEE